MVNQWGSWCGPCREEFPHFQNQAAEHLDEVAFLGVDTEDSADAYDTFIRDHPIPYPSVADLDGEFGNWIDTALVGQPNTVFYDERGELVYTHQGPYETEADLAADIETLRAELLAQRVAIPTGATSSSSPSCRPASP